MDAALADDGVLLAVNRLSPLDRARVEPSIRYDTCGVQCLRSCCLVCSTMLPLDTARVEPSIRCGMRGAQCLRTCCLVCIVVSPLTMRMPGTSRNERTAAAWQAASLRPRLHCERKFLHTRSATGNGAGYRHGAHELRAKPTPKSACPPGM